VEVLHDDGQRCAGEQERRGGVHAPDGSWHASVSYSVAAEWGLGEHVQVLRRNGCVCASKY
jgi:hypothetical protein